MTSDAIKSFDPRALASITTGISMVDDFGQVHEAIDHALGHQVWTHELVMPGIVDAAIDAVLRQFPDMPTAITGTWQETAEAVTARYGASVKLRKGSLDRTSSPVETRHGTKGAGMTSKFDPNKPVRTRDGRPARIICMDCAGVKPIIALVKIQSGEEAIYTFNADGSYWQEDRPYRQDLVNITKRHVRWINIHIGYTGSNFYRSRAEADKYADANRIACICIEFEDGEGLEDEK